MNIETSEKETVGIIKTVKNKKVIELLRKQGKNVIEFPELKIEKIRIGKDERALLENITGFDWLIFTDVFSVDFFLEDLADTGFEIYRLDDLKICSCGEAIADRLRFSQVHSDVVPRLNQPEIISQSISDYIFDEDEFYNSKFLMLKSAEKNTELSKAFLHKKLNFTEIANYKILENNSFENAKFKLLLTERSIDRFIFTSPEDFESLRELAGKESLNNLLDSVEMESTDEITTVTLRENGM